jgi:hypothetical protein
MPLRLELTNASVNSSGDSILEVTVENIGKDTVELPISQNYADVEAKQGEFRRELSFGVRAANSESSRPNIIGVTAGSRTVPDSLVLIKPEGSIRALIRVESDWVRSSIPAGKKLVLRVTCGGWALKGDKFEIESTAREIASANTATLGFNGGTPTAAISGP